MVKLKDIAEVCGVSIATVSRVLNGKPNVNRGKADFILRMARDMGYNSYPPPEKTAGRWFRLYRYYL